MNEYILKVSETVIETEEEFIFKSISSFCEDIVERRVNKKELTDILINARENHAKWIDRPNPQWKAYDIRYCSKCGWNIPKSKLRNKDLDWKYCPNCGAKMYEEVIK